MADQIEGNERNHSTYRHAACDYITDHEDEFAPFLPDQSVEEYIAWMRADKRWGGNMEIQALSKQLRVNFVIH